VRLSAPAAIFGLAATPGMWSIGSGHDGVGLLAAPQKEAAAAFIQFMTDPANTALLRKGFMEPPAR
jgi:ABC-type glycerol-3-phosphate transport system substrate-binding protein